MMNTRTLDFGPSTTYPDLKGKVAVVTGGSRGIGTTTARALAVNGVSICVVGRDPVAIEHAVSTVTAVGSIGIGVVADCTVEHDLDVPRQRVGEELGSVDILIAFAGGHGMPVATNSETVSHWREVIDSDLTSTFLTVSTSLPQMLERHAGVIVTMASAAARQAAQSAAAHAAAKAGVIAFSRHLAGECAHDGIRVNCVAPSAIENDRTRSWMTAEQRQALGAAFPLGRIGQPEDVAAATLFLASPASSWITGITLDVAGGKIML
jgi:3-oxoacyl-[acyl-carrier protein] reductase